MARLDDWLPLTRAELGRLLSQGRPIDPARLDDTEYRGVSLGLPRVVDRLAWKKFKKVFYRDRDTGVLRGWNVRLEQNALDGPSIPKMRGGQAVAFGHYAVVPLDTSRVPLPCPHGLLLDYSLGKNRRSDPVRCVRDPIVALEAESTELLLGWTYLDFGALQLRTPSFFVLEREGRE